MQIETILFAGLDFLEDFLVYSFFFFHSETTEKNKTRTLQTFKATEKSQLQDWNKSHPWRNWNRHQMPAVICSHN